MNSATCPAPWVGLYIDQWGAKPCCEFKGPALDSFEPVRLSMLQGISPEGCYACSERTGSGDRTLQFYLKSQFPDVNYFDRNQDPQFMQIRFDNLCNAVCRMCNADSSNLWHEDDIALGRIDLIGKESVRSSGSFDSLLAKYDLSRIKRVHVFGGEPLIQKNAWKLLDLFKDRSDVTLQYNTNLSKLQHSGNSILDAWANAKCLLEISGSIEGTGRSYEYIRSGLSWGKFEHNCNEVMKLAAEHEGRIKFGLHTSQSILSAPYYPDVLDFLIGLNQTQRARLCYNQITLSSAIVTQPDYLDLRNLRDIDKGRVRDYLELRAQNTIWGKHPYLSETFAAIITWMFSREGSSSMMEKFWQSTCLLDRRRNENILESLPELSLMTGAYEQPT